MDDDIDQLLVSVRADTRGFAADMARMKSEFDATVLSGFAGAGDVLERSLLSAIRRGSLGFEDLKRIAGSVLDQIAAQAMQIGFDSLLGGSGGSLGGLLNGVIGALTGLPGRATGGIVAPDRPYLVGERGPELFVPTSAGRVEANGATPAGRTDVRVAISLAAPRGTDAPVALQRSSRQLASAVRRALMP